MDAMTSSATLAKHLGPPSRLAAARGWLYEHRRWFLVVMLPTLLVASYFWLIAANQYESEAHFIVRAAQDTQRPAGLGSALSFGGSISSGQTDAYSVGDYLTSHDAVEALQKRIDLIGRFRRPEADWIARLSDSMPTAENLLKYYRKQVDVKFDSDTGIATLRVRSFRPADSLAIVNSLLTLGEERVNALNRRLYDSTLGIARTQLSNAEEQVNRSQALVTAFRQGGRDIDPQSSGQAQIGLAAELQGRLAQLQAAEQSMTHTLAPNSPQLIAQRSAVRALQAQLASVSGRTAGGQNSIAAGLGDYQGLQLRQQFAAKQYDAAAAAMQRARDEAQRQQLFIVRVVEPNLPEKALYPKSSTVIFTTFFGLCLVYGIGWLIAAGVREHAA